MMIQKSVISLVIVLAAGIQLSAEEDFERSYAPAPMIEIFIDNKLGDINVSGYDGKEIKVSAKKKGSDKDSIKIIEKKFGPRIHIFPEAAKFKKNETSVDFEVKVPASTQPVFAKLIVKSKGRNTKVPPPPTNPVYVKLIVKSKDGNIEIHDFNFNGMLEAQSDSGNITVKDSQGNVFEAKSDSGNITVKDFSGGLRADNSRGIINVTNVEGHVSAVSQSGEMKAEIKQAKSSSQLSFRSISGDIKVTVPKDISAWVEMKSSSGNLETDFALDHHKRLYGQNTARGKLGSEEMQRGMIFMETVSGSVSLLKE